MSGDRFIDRIEAVAPGLVRRYYAARLQALQYRRIFDAAKTTTLRKRPRDTRSGDAVVAHAGTSIRQWARHLDENHDIAIGILDCLVNRIVGAGLTYEPMIRKKNGEPDLVANRSAREAFKAWSRAPEVTGELPRSELERLVCRTWLRDGDAFAQDFLGLGTGYPFPTPVPYVLECFEPDYLPFDKNERTPRIVQGIERDRWGRPAAYHFYTRHPGDTLLSGAGFTSDTRRVDAALICHLKFTRRIPQGRGQSIFHGVLTRLDDLKEYEESERIAARVAAAFTAAIERTGDFNANVDATAYNAGDPLQRNFELGPGMIFDNLLPGEKVTTISSNRPNSQLPNFVLDQLRRVSAGTGTTASTISRNYDGSYSSQRQELVEGQVAYDRLQSYFFGRFASRMYRNFANAALLAGELVVSRETDISTIDSVLIRGPGMPWIDVDKESRADERAVTNGFKSTSQVIRERGGDPDAVREQRAADQAADRALGLETSPPTTGQAGAGDASDDELDDELDDTTRNRPARRRANNE